MKKIFCLLLFLNLIVSNYSYSQKYNSVDSIVDAYPKNIINTNKLVELITKDFLKQDEKVRAVYRWITTNIGYDVSVGESMNYTSTNAFSYKTEKEREIKEKQFKLGLVSNAMSSRKAVCHGYAALVEDLCLKLGIETKIILGNLKSDPSEIGTLPEITNHAWNIVKIDTNWQFVDATLGAGFISGSTNLFRFYFNDFYFFPNPDRFFLSHYPNDEKWLLVAKNKKDFAELPLFFGNYFEFNYQLIKPESGIYSTDKNENFIFSIRGLDQYDTVEYSFSTDNKIIYLDQKNDLNYMVSLANIKDNYLSIYVNGKIIAIYKII